MVLARGVEQRAVDPRGQVALQLDVRRLDRPRRTVDRGEVLGDLPRAEAAHLGRVAARQRQHRADTVGGVVHRRQARPVIRPAVHVLLVRGLQELNPAEVAVLVELLHEQELARVHDGLHHHVLLAARDLRLNDALAVLDAGRHRHRAGDVLAGLQRLNGLLGVERNRRVDVDRVDVRVLQQLGVIGVALLDPEGVADGVQLLLIALADRDRHRIRVSLVDGDELGAKAEPDERNANGTLVRHRVVSPERRGSAGGRPESVGCPIAASRDFGDHQSFCGASQLDPNDVIRLGESTSSTQAPESFERAQRSDAHCKQ